MEEHAIPQLWNYRLFKSEKYSIPFINCPFKEKLNPYLSDCLGEHLEWLKTIFQQPQQAHRFIQFESYIVNAYLFPLSSKEEFKYINMVNDWIYVFDDLYLEYGTISQEYIDHLFDPEAIHEQTDDNFAFRFWQGFRPLYQIPTCNRQSLNHYLRVIRDWSHSIISLNHDPSLLRATMTLSEYVDIRYNDIGSIMVMACAMISHRVLPETIINNHQLKELLYWYTLANLLVSDIYSFKKEINNHKLDNYIKIRAIQTESIQIAMESTVNAIHHAYNKINVISDLLQNDTQLSEDDQQLLKDYITRLKYATAGNLRASIICPRKSAINLVLDVNNIQLFLGTVDEIE
ncbi:hypothetical protein DLAC_10965 [Tieghemostelium lacteum]|uniref:Terpene synthase n=1 Tax=Tieghemostelium lacteum TaxID=361077 RepID=A0A151Z379_TIELA|nr:hypothetical protein DLAC_10965 [Tieghemostelium lacteum]|eukprot:KYQ88274.1 hypothetical protein DLAC_10965 [Tieghemostelium lacteum]